MSTEGYFNPGHEPDDPQIGDPDRPAGLHHDDMPNGPWAAAEAGWEGAIKRYQDWLENEHGVYLQIDEVSLLFFDPEHLFNYVTQAVAQKEVRLTQTAQDLVHVDPIRSHYQVGYWFLEHMDKTYRLELMLKDGGLSPVHDQMRFLMEHSPLVLEETDDDEGSKGDVIKAPVAVHLSFKTPSHPDYTLVNQGFNENEDCEYVQFCRSSYGQFAYWRVNSLWEHAAVYLKPRVNMRDGAE